MRIHAVSLSLALGLSAIVSTPAQTPPTPAGLDDYNVRWDSPSRDASGSMPIGNGEVGLNVWVEENGDLLFYIARTDAWSEISRLLKLGRIRIRLSPSPLEGGTFFLQELNLRQGHILADGFVQAGPSALASPRPMTQFHVRIVTHAA
jgi:hypothetical protein